jgi:hypothetical protein
MFMDKLLWLVSIVYQALGMYIDQDNCRLVWSFYAFL